jgi:DNA-binding NtrC family response regulator
MAVVLFVEDDDDVRELAAEFLSRAGFSMVTGRNGDEGLEILRGSQPVDLLCTDVVMPGSIDGIELARRALELRPGLPVIIMSGYPGHAQARMTTDELSAAPFLRKPYRLPLLVNMINQLLLP